LLNAFHIFAKNQNCQLLKPNYNCQQTKQEALVVVIYVKV
jgi:hypothetical protein